LTRFRLPLLVTFWIRRPFFNRNPKLQLIGIVLQTLQLADDFRKVGNDYSTVTDLTTARTDKRFVRHFDRQYRVTLWTFDLGRGEKFVDADQKVFGDVYCRHLKRLANERTGCTSFCGFKG
jgi:hypothetical protein